MGEGGSGGGRCLSLRRRRRRYCRPDCPCRGGKWTEVENRRACKLENSSKFRHPDCCAPISSTRLSFQNTTKITKKNLHGRDATKMVLKEDEEVSISV